jgi:uncharacterized protein
MQYKFIDKEIKYDGSQLTSRWAYMNFGVLGDSCVSFVGPCNVSRDHMVDGEDLLAGAEICGDLMLHFIVEQFEPSLPRAVLTQRLFAALALEELNNVCVEDQMKVTSGQRVRRLFRDGDDLYLGNACAKLSISIATVSPVSSLIHFALNIVTAGTPVKTSCLNDLGVEAREFSRRLGARFVSEVRTMALACAKVRWVP